MPRLNEIEKRHVGTVGGVGGTFTYNDAEWLIARVRELDKEIKRGNGWLVSRVRAYEDDNGKLIARVRKLETVLAKIERTIASPAAKKMARKALATGKVNDVKAG